MDSNMSDMISKLLSDPESMKKIMEMANSIGAANPPQQQGSDSGGTAVPTMASSSDDGGSEALGRAVRALGSLTSAPAANSRHTALLTALKPYMRDQRQQRLDGAVKLLGAVKMLRNMGGGK